MSDDDKAVPSGRLYDKDSQLKQSMPQDLRVSLQSNASPDTNQPTVPRARFSTGATGLDTSARESFLISSPARSLSNNDVSPASSRNRGRGYSLRRSMLSQNMQEKNATTTRSFEMQAPILASPQTSKSPNSPTRETAVTISEPAEDQDGRPVSWPARSSGLRNDLPMYRRWLSKQGSHSSLSYRLRKACNEIADRLFRHKQMPPSPDGRHVRTNTSPSVELTDERTKKPHINNLIMSCRYDLWNFVPRQLMAQFGKLANFYFLCVSILQMIPGLSTTGAYTTIIPLLIFIGISMAKEGYDDVRRHRLDKEENERQIDVLETHVAVSPMISAKRQEALYPETISTGWRKEKWQNVRVGDVVLLVRDSSVPADVVLLQAEGPSSTAYVETKGLDGETNLKAKKPLPDLSRRCPNLDSIASLDAEFLVEDPNLDLYRFNGKVSVGGDTLPLTNTEIIYRGSVLRNTKAAAAVVIYSGEECKIRMNANKSPRIKAPTLQGLVNKVVIFIAGLVLFIALLMTGLYQVWRRTTTGGKSFYLEAAVVPFGHVLTSFIIMFNTMLPLSLYVALEIVKVAQIFLMNDIDMYEPESDTPMEPHTSTINEELGQVSYIFSDKTGTLTNNSMKFRKMSMAGTAWLHDFDLQEAASSLTPRLMHKRRDVKGKEKISSGTEPIIQGFGWKPSTGRNQSLHCGKTEQLMDHLSRKPSSPFARKAKFFMLGLALCHTCTPEKDEEGTVSFQAASPDEVALVNAASDMGCIVTDRQANSITIKTYPLGDDEDPAYNVYEILEVVDFSSARKRMSIILRMPDGRICLFTKGADTTVRKLLRLSDLASSTVSNVQQRASQRKAMEAQEVIRRKSTQMRCESQRPHSSFALATGPSDIGRHSSISLGRGHSARESVDLWLKEQERDVNLTMPRRSNSFYTPRQSPQSTSLKVSDPSDMTCVHGGRPSVDTETSTLIDDAVAVSDTAAFDRCFQHIDDFATEGLRTLLYGYRILSEEQYREWREVYAKASTSLIDRQEKMEAASEMIETNLELLGATAIEDKLQEGVPNAIDRFRRAGIKLWMLTGDKRETAINIGHSCRLIKDYSTVIVLDHELGNLSDRMTDAVANVNSQRTAHSVLVIDGQTLTLIDINPAAKAQFTDLAVLADSVICCRASPSQKASLVRTIRTKVKGSVTLAVGDGANDIAMIQEAHIGIGIAGKEGLQAARTSDYSIAQFRFLLKLLLVHGRWNYIRICKYTLGTFYKEMLFYLVQALYQHWDGYSGTSLYEPWSLSMFNTLFTSLPVIFMGVFEKDLAASTLLAVPELYNIGQRNDGFNFKLYAYWATLGASEAVIIYFTMYKIYGEALFTPDSHLYAMGCLAFSACVTIISFKLQAIELHNKSIAAVIAVVLSVGGWWMFNLALSGFYPKDDPVYFVNRGITDKFGRNPLWWLTLILIVLTVVMFEILLKFIWSTTRPTDVDTFQAYERDIKVRKRFEEAAADILQQGWDRGIKKPSLEVATGIQGQAEREAQIQEILDRPRTLENPTSSIRRRHSQPINAEDLTTLTPTVEGLDVTRKSVDTGELFRKGFGEVKTGRKSQ